MQVGRLRLPFEGFRSHNENLSLNGTNGPAFLTFYSCFLLLPQNNVDSKRAGEMAAGEPHPSALCHLCSAIRPEVFT